MPKATLNSMSTSERELVAATETTNLQTLDEDALIALHDRVRRARTKAVQLHRREVADQVAVKGSRGAASSPPRRSASKAEVFEMALARVSTSLARRARQSAAELRASRLDTARRSSAADAKRVDAKVNDADTKPATTASSRARRRPPVERKTAAAKRAAGARRQAASDAR